MTVPPDDVPRLPAEPPPFPVPPRYGDDGPARRRGLRGLLVVLASVAVLAVGLVDLGLSSRAPAVTPSAAAPTSTSPVLSSSPGSTAGASGSAGVGPARTGHPSAAPSAADVEAQVAAVEATVPGLRDLQPTRTVPNRVIDEAQLRRDMTRLFDQENPPAATAAEQAMLQRMGLLPVGFDLRSRYLDALGTGVAGYYDERTRTMTIVQRSSGFGPVERLTLAHEYTHALQDMHFGLSSLEGTDTTQGDRSLARTALIEGDASLAMARYAQRFMSPVDLLAVAAAAGDPAQTQMLQSLPPLLRRQLEFPYVDGLRFVNALYARGGWAAVDAAYARPPSSTSQILHPDLYLTGVEPVAVSLPDVPGSLGTGWRQSRIDTAGEMATSVWLSNVAGSSTASAIASGWAGDRVGSYDGPRGAWAEVWVTAWTSGTEASAFAAAAESAATPPPAGTTRRVIAGPGVDRVTVVFASDAATMTTLLTVLGG